MLVIFIASLCSLQLFLFLVVWSDTVRLPASSHRLSLVTAEISVSSNIAQNSSDSLVNGGNKLEREKLDQQLINTYPSSLKGKTPDQLLINNSHLSSPFSSPKTNNKPGQCLDEWCVSNLQKSSLRLYKHCQTLSKSKNPLGDVPKRCSFRRAKDHDIVALVSVPGSGNTWVRGLLEKATGICTGSIYCDVPLRNGGFVGENILDGSVLVVKTHTSDFQWRGVRLEKRNFFDSFYDAAIVLIRNPFNTFVAERHRTFINKVAGKGKISHKTMRTGAMESHVDRVGGEAFGEFVELTVFPPQ